MSKVDDVFELVKSMTILELRALNKLIEDEFGITANLAVGSWIGPVAEQQTSEEPKEEKTEFDVVLRSYGVSKVEVIKVIREVTHLGLLESKNLTETLPSRVRGRVSRQEAEEVRDKLVKAGAEVGII